MQKAEHKSTLPKKLPKPNNLPRDVQNPIIEKLFANAEKEFSSYKTILSKALEVAGGDLNDNESKKFFADANIIKLRKDISDIALPLVLENESFKAWGVTGEESARPYAKFIADVALLKTTASLGDSKALTTSLIGTFVTHGM